MSFAKTVTLDQKSIDFVNFLMKELNIENFSQALRITVTYAKIYKLGTAVREEERIEMAILKREKETYAGELRKNTDLFYEISSILKYKWSDKQKIAKLKEIL